MLRSPLVATCAALALSIVGCGSCGDKTTEGKAKPKAAEKPKDPPDVAAIKRLADEMCGCSDTPCAEDVRKRFNKFVAEHRATATTRAAHHKASRRLMACYRRVAKPGGTPVDPTATRIAQRFGKLADTACACTDATCAGKAVAQMYQLDSSFARTKTSTHSRDALAERRRFTECVKKLAGGKSPAHLAVEASLAELRDIAKFVCSCKGASCRRKAGSRMIRWRTMFHGIRPDQQEQKLVTDVQKKMRSCLQRATKKK